MISAREIKTEQTIEIRHKVLREGFPIETCYWNNDHLPGTFHIGGFLGKKLVGTSTFQAEPYPEEPGITAYRLRGMAVLPEAERNGIATLMLALGEDRIRNMSVALCWCHARIGAVPFYEKNGWKTVGDAFDIPTVGLHYLMFKDLTQAFGCKGSCV